MRFRRGTPAAGEAGQQPPADPLAGAEPLPIGPEMADVAGAYALDAVALGRLALFGRRHPDAAQRLADVTVAHLRSLGPAHPAARALQVPPDFYQRTCVRLLSGKLDAEVLDRLRFRATQLVDDDTPPPLMFTYVGVVGPTIHAIARDAGYPEAVAFELAATISRVAAVYAIVSCNSFTEVAVQRVAGLEQLHGVSTELAGLSQRLEAIAYSGGPTALSGRVESALLSLEEVAAHASNIGGVVELIRSIAAQTNLLALNATIEAARAGQQGKGFAVVASEVKNLAHSTHQSLGRIEELVNGMRTSVERATGSVSGVEAATEELRATAGTMTELSRQLQA